MKKTIVWLFLTVSLVILSACAQATPAPTVTPTLTAEAILPSATPTPEPTATPEIPRLWYVPGNAGWVNDVHARLTELAGLQGWTLERLESLPASLEAGVRLVVAGPQTSGLAELAAANPSTAFLGIGIDGLAPSTNLSVIGSDGAPADRLGFLAGYLAAVITEDWRVGVLSPNDTAEGRAAANSFSNGTRFFCGLCSPAFPPYVYPQIGALSSSASVAEWAAVSELLGNVDNDVRTLFLAPGTGDASLAEALAAQNRTLILSSGSGETTFERTAAVIGYSPLPGLDALWPDLVNGVGGGQQSLALQVTVVNPAILTPGRMRLVEELLTELNAGRIDTGVDPASGELR